jgi:hypothetical protein
MNSDDRYRHSQVQRAQRLGRQSSRLGHAGQAPLSAPERKDQRSPRHLGCDSTTF